MEQKLDKATALNTTGSKTQSAGPQLDEIAVVEACFAAAPAIDDQSVTFDARQIGNMPVVIVFAVNCGMVAMHRPAGNTNVVVVLASDPDHIAGNWTTHTPGARFDLDERMAATGDCFVGKLGLAFVRVMPEERVTNPAYLRVLMPNGKAGYVTVDSLAPFGNDQLCYVKQGGAWKIGGYIGAGEPQ